MLKIAVCDDERQFRKIIKEYVGNYLQKHEILFQIDEFASGTEFLELEEQMCRYQVVFLDINMGEIDGITTAEKLREYSDTVIIVFVTAYIDYSLVGYKVNAIRYLLKSSQNLEDDFEECMDAVLEKVNYTESLKKIQFREGEKEINLNSILYIESRLHLLEFHMADGGMEIESMYGTLNAWEEKLKPCRFLRTHQSYLVNLRYVKRIEKGYVVLKDKTSLPIPRARQKEVQKAIDEYSFWKVRGKAEI